MTRREIANQKFTTLLTEKQQAIITEEIEHRLIWRAERELRKTHSFGEVNIVYGKPVEQVKVLIRLFLESTFRIWKKQA